MWQDCDDYYEKDAVELMVSFLDQNQQYDFVRGESVYRNESNTDEIVFHGKSKYPEINNIFNLFLFEKDTYNYPGIFLVRMKYFDECIRNREIYVSRGGQNWQLILPIAYNGKCGYLPKVVYNYIISPNSHSHVYDNKHRIIRCNEHKEILKNVICSIRMPFFKKLTYIILINTKYFFRKLRIYLSIVKRKVMIINDSNR